MITDTLDLYKNSVGFYKKDFILQNTADSHVAIRFEGVYMNCAVWVNNKLAGEWKYGYSTFEFDISSLVHDGTNSILVIAVYQNPNTRWYSGAGIFRDVNLIQKQKMIQIPEKEIRYAGKCIKHRRKKSCRVK